MAVWSVSAPRLEFPRGRGRGDGARTSEGAATPGPYQDPARLPKRRFDDARKNVYAVCEGMRAAPIRSTLDAVGGREVWPAVRALIPEELLSYDRPLVVESDPGRPRPVIDGVFLVWHLPVTTVHPSGRSAEVLSRSWCFRSLDASDRSIASSRAFFLGRTDANRSLYVWPLGRSP